MKAHPLKHQVGSSLPYHSLTCSCCRGYQCPWCQAVALPASPLCCWTARTFLGWVLTVPASSQPICGSPPTALFHLRPPILLPAVSLPSAAPGTAAHRALWLLCTTPAGRRAGSPAVPACWHHLQQDAWIGAPAAHPWPGTEPADMVRAAGAQRGRCAAHSMATCCRVPSTTSHTRPWGPCLCTPMQSHGCSPSSNVAQQQELCLQALGCYKPAGLMTAPSRCRVCSLWKLYSGWRCSSSTEPGSAMSKHCTPAPAESQSLLTPLQGCLNTGNSEYLPGEGGRHVYLGKDKAGQMCTLLAIMPFAAE